MKTKWKSYTLSVHFQFSDLEYLQNLNFWDNNFFFLFLNCQLCCPKVATFTFIKTSKILKPLTYFILLISTYLSKMQLCSCDCPTFAVFFLTKQIWLLMLGTVRSRLAGTGEPDLILTFEILFSLEVVICTFQRATFGIWQRIFPDNPP